MEKLTEEQINYIVKAVSQIYSFKNCGSCYKITRIRTGENSWESCSMVSYDLGNFITNAYLTAVKKDYNELFDWQKAGVLTSNTVKSYMYFLERQIVEILCGFKNDLKEVL